jgi:hypothetical protein
MKDYCQVCSTEVIIGIRVGILDHINNNCRYFILAWMSDCDAINNAYTKSNYLFEKIGDYDDEYR